VDGRTDMTKHIVAFRNFAKAPRSPYRFQYQTKLKLIILFKAWFDLDTNVLEEPAAFTVKAARCQSP
jgi:hypothetical protein